MPAKPSTLVQFSRFLSIAVLSCVLMTGGMWLYQNRNDIAGGIDSFRKEGGFHSVTWFMRWCGVDSTKLKEDGHELFDKQKAIVPTKFEMDPDWIKQLHQPYQFDWDSNNR
jgi:hypothetical protein